MHGRRLTKVNQSQTLHDVRPPPVLVYTISGVNEHWGDELASQELDGCIVWNAHNIVFGSKRSAIYALTVYFVHLTRPKIQGLVSRDSIVDRQFVTAWVREWVTNIRFMCRAVPSAVV